MLNTGFYKSLARVLAACLVLLWTSVAPAHQGQKHANALQENIDHRQSAAGGGNLRERIDFTLTTDQGEWKLSSLRGKVVLLVFGYMNCPDVCPTSLQVLAEAFDQLEPELKQQVRGVFVSLDPDRDDPAKLRQYASFFHPNIIGVTGPKAEVRALADDLGVRFKLRRSSQKQLQEPDQASYSVDHSTLAFAIDQQGYKLMVLVSHAAPPSFVAQLIRETLVAGERPVKGPRSDG